MFSLVFLRAVGRNLLPSNLDPLLQEYVQNSFLLLHKKIGVPLMVIYGFQAYIPILNIPRVVYIPIRFQSDTILSCTLKLHIIAWHLNYFFKLLINIYQYSFYEFLIVQTLKVRIPGTYHCMIVSGYKRLRKREVLFVHCSLVSALRDLLKSDGPQLP